MDSLDAKLESLSLSKFNTFVVDSKDSLEECKIGLKDQKVLAWDCEGVCISRSGKLTIIQLGTNSNCYLLDILSPAKEEILKFAKTILEDKDIVKIIHDPAADSDGLFHSHGIRVENVHDTQAWHMVIKGPSQKPNLNATLTAFACGANDARDSSVYARNPSFWATRPITKEMKEWASGDVQFLFDLYDEQTKIATTAQKEKAVDMSNKRNSAMRDSITRDIQIHSTQTGNFIG